MQSFELTDQKSQSKKYIRCASLLLKIAVAIACLIYIIRCGRDIKPEDLKIEFIPVAVIGAFGYFLATFLMVYGWWLCLKFSSMRQCSFKQYSKIYFASVPAKYLPSNVMHFAARHFKVINSGISHSAAAGSNILENIYIVFAAVIIITAGTLSGQINLPSDFLNDIIGSCYTTIAVFSVAAVIYYLIRKYASRLSISNILITSVKILIGYIIFLFITGYIFYLVMNITSSQNLEQHRLQIIFIYICAWTIGLITPGAPGGMGVRESAIIYLISDISTSEQALLGALLFRLITVSGEIIGYFYCKLLK